MESINESTKLISQTLDSLRNANITMNILQVNVQDDIKRLEEALDKLLTGK